MRTRIESRVLWRAWKDSRESLETFKMLLDLIIGGDEDYPEKVEQIDKFIGEMDELYDEPEGGGE